MSKTQIEFYGTIGSNDPSITEDLLRKALMSMEIKFNSDGRMRLHIAEGVKFPDYEGTTPIEKLREIQAKLIEKGEKRLGGHGG